MRSRCDEELRNGSEVKIDILDEGYWSPELFRGYQVMTSVSERSFGGPDKRWGASPRGLSTTPTPSHVTWRGRGATHRQPPLPAWGGQVS